MYGLLKALSHLSLFLTHSLTLPSLSPSSSSFELQGKMKGRLCCFVMAMQLVSWVSATSRPFPAHDDDHAVHQPGPCQSQQSSQVFLDSKQSSKTMEGMREINEEAYYREVSKIGSSPPSCEHKCYGCFPCVAIQVPTITSHVGLQYTNYEPEGWKCRCGPSLYSP